MLLIVATILLNVFLGLREYQDPKQVVPTTIVTQVAAAPVVKAADEVIIAPDSYNKAEDSKPDATETENLSVEPIDPAVEKAASEAPTSDVELSSVSNEDATENATEDAGDKATKDSSDNANANATGGDSTTPEPTI